MTENRVCQQVLDIPESKLSGQFSVNFEGEAGIDAGGRLAWSWSTDRWGFSLTFHSDELVTALHRQWS
jgi:hypothetical protein